MSLYSVLKSKVNEWRKSNYKSENFIISEIFDFNYDSENQVLSFLRKTQFEALETYWYLRLIEKTPHIFDLYKKYFSKKQLFESIGLKHLVENIPEDLLSEDFVNKTINKIKTDEDFTKQNRIEAIKETLTLEYPGYILALAMGAGKTILIGC